MSDYYIGEIRLFSGKYAPVGWHLCDGSLLAINQYEALYSLVGTTYGGDGQTTFGLPDLRGRLPIGQGTGPGLTARVLAQQVGTETVALTSANGPAHTHYVKTAGAAANTPIPGPTVTFANTASPTIEYLTSGLGSAVAAPVNPAAATISSEGAGAEHANIMPCAMLNYIIALNGLYPTRP